MVCKKDLKSSKGKNDCEIGYDHSNENRKTHYYNNRIVVVIVVVLLFLYYSIVSGLACVVARLVGLLCAGWIMGDLNKPLLFGERAQARKKARARKAARPHKRYKPIKTIYFMIHRKL